MATSPRSTKNATLFPPVRNEPDAISILALKEMEQYKFEEERHFLQKHRDMYERLMDKAKAEKGIRISAKAMMLGEYQREMDTIDRILTKLYRQEAKDAT